MLGRTAVLAIALFGIIAGCDGEGGAGAYSLDVTPGSMNAVVGQRCVLLVQVKDDQGVGDVEITASAEGAKVIVEYSPIDGKGVAEVTVIPDSTTLGKTVSVTIRGVRGIAENSVEVPIAVIDWDPVDEAVARGYMNKFIPWLAENHPELGIDADTKWTATSANPNFLIVRHQLFFSDRWEMGLVWHVMIPPDDWTQIYLRERGKETRPSLAFEITSVDAGDPPHAIDPPETVDR
jgi:hypothetical protein